MARFEEITLSDFLDNTRDQLQNSTITEIYQFTYFSTQTDYKLPGYRSDDPRVLDIEAIEGVSFDGDFLTEDDLVEGTDYSLWNDYGSNILVDDGYGTATGQQIYTGISITALTFENNSTITVRYTWHDPDFKPVLTNFAGNAVLRMILSSVATNLQQYMIPIADSINTFGINATGDDLIRLYGLVGGEQTPAQRTTGKVEITNSSGETFSITSATRFVALTAGSFVEFQSQTGSGTVADGATDVHDVIAVEAGAQGNVGAYSITKIFTDDTLATEVTNVTVTNPPVVNEGGEQFTNYFDNGTDEESEEEIRRNILLAFRTLNTSSYSTIRQTVLDTGLISDAKVYDQEVRKGVSANTIQVIVSSESGNILSPSALTTIKNAADTVKPVGANLFVRQALHTYLTFDATIYVDEGTLSETSSLADLLVDGVSGHINDRPIGEDIIPSTLLTIMRSNANIKDVDLTEATLTEYASETNSAPNNLIIRNDASDYSVILLQITFNSIRVGINDTYTGTPSYVIAEDMIDERVSPRVNKAVLGHDNKWRVSPLESITPLAGPVDYFTSVTPLQTINYDDTSLNTNQEMFFDYNYFDNLKLDGIRVWLGGDNGNVVDVRIVSVPAGATPTGPIDDGGNIDTVTGTNGTITLDGTTKLYEFEFASQQGTYPASGTHFDLNTYDYYIMLQHSSGANTSYLPAEQFTGSFPLMYGDGGVESSPSTPNDTFTKQLYKAIYEVYTKFTGVNAYSKVVIPSKAYNVEKPRYRSLSMTFTAFEEE